jgi:hypothetical protein
LPFLARVAPYSLLRSPEARMDYPRRIAEEIVQKMHAA